MASVEYLEVQDQRPVVLVGQQDVAQRGEQGVGRPSTLSHDRSVDLDIGDAGCQPEPEHRLLHGVVHAQVEVQPVDHEVPVRVDHAPQLFHVGDRDRIALVNLTDQAERISGDIGNLTNLVKAAGVQAMLGSLKKRSCMSMSCGRITSNVEMMMCSVCFGRPEPGSLQNNPRLVSQHLQSEVIVAA
jgi:hypothetical protein